MIELRHKRNLLPKRLQLPLLDLHGGVRFLVALKALHFFIEFGKKILLTFVWP